jgi:hypothetical protein
MKEGKILSGEEYINLCRLRDKEHKGNYNKLIYLFGSHTPFVKERLSVRFPNKHNKVGYYNNINPFDIEYIMILAPDNTLKQTRWLECMVSIKNEGLRKMFLFFEPFFFDHIPHV